MFQSVDENIVIRHGQWGRSAKTLPVIEKNGKPPCPAKRFLGFFSALIMIKNRI